MPHNHSKKFQRSLVWLRRDLRLKDNAALYKALQQSEHVWLLFVLDKEILDPLIEQGLTKDRRLSFIYDSLEELNNTLASLGTGLILRHGQARTCVPEIAELLKVDAVWTNQDYEPMAIARDRDIDLILKKNKRHFFLLKDQTIFHQNEILTKSGQAYSIFTPYKKAWLEKLTPSHLLPYSTKPYLNALAPIPDHMTPHWPSLESIGFQRQPLSHPGGTRGAQILLNKFSEHVSLYHLQKDYPALSGSSELSVHLRFGTISIRQLAQSAYTKMQTGDPGAKSWLSELIWRDFYFMILYHHPKLAEGASFKPEYDAIEWERGPQAQLLFETWCKSTTGYPIIDAAMRQLNQTGWMHNRLRMIVASFLCKDLGVDWRWGEHYFAQQLNDFDLAANNGGWQWVSSSGCDAQPYFRIFNPILQSKKFDPEGIFIRKYIPELRQLPNQWIHCPWLAPTNTLSDLGVKLGENYPQPIINHQYAREQTLKRYATVKTQAK